jgi:hypothetical protein
MHTLIKFLRAYRLTAGLADRPRLDEEIFRHIEPGLRLFVFGAIGADAAKDVLQEVLKAVTIYNSLKPRAGDFGYGSSSQRPCFGCVPLPPAFSLLH